MARVDFCYGPDFGVVPDVIARKGDLLDRGKLQTCSQSRAVTVIDTIVMIITASPRYHFPCKQLVVGVGQLNQWAIRRGHVPAQHVEFARNRARGDKQRLWINAFLVRSGCSSMR